jgi:adenylosuccinate lyase
MAQSCSPRSTPRPGRCRDRRSGRGDVLRHVGAVGRGGGGGLTDADRRRGRPAAAWEHGGRDDGALFVRGLPSRARRAAARPARRAVTARAVAPLAQTSPRRRSTVSGLHVEVAWLEHLARSHAVPGSGRSPTRRSRTCGVSSTASTPRPSRSSPRSSGPPCTTSRRARYYLKRALEGTSLADVAEYVHVFSTERGRQQPRVRPHGPGAVREVWLPAATALVADSTRWPPPWRTSRCSPAPTARPPRRRPSARSSPSSAHRLPASCAGSTGAEYLGKANGATGTYAAHVVAAPETDWVAVTRRFVEGLGLTWNPLTTQIESHDWQAELYADVARFNRILHNLCTDVWTYISLGYFARSRRGPGHGRLEHDAAQGQPDPVRERRGEPRGQLRAARLLASTLVTSRLQRDLTDSTTQRNIGTAFGHSLLAIENVRRGLAGLEADPTRWRATSTPTGRCWPRRSQSVMRVHGLEQPYERLKELTRAGGSTGRPSALHRDARPPGRRQRASACPDAGHVHGSGRRARRALRRRPRLRLAGVPGPGLTRPRCDVPADRGRRAPSSRRPAGTPPPDALRCPHI